ncbi:MAG: sulfatase [Akkermansiaceae bacterium]
MATELPGAMMGAMGRRAMIWAVAIAFTSTMVAAPLNVLMIAVDDMRPELGCYGAKHVLSPNLDRFAASALLFERAYCQQAICGPSRASLLTGLRPDSVGIHGNHAHYRDKHPKLETLPQYFKNRGYFAAACGKINHGVFPQGKAPKWDTMGDAQSWSVPAFRPGPRYYYTEEGVAAAQGVFRKMFSQRPLSEWDQFLTFGPLTEAAPVEDEVLYDGQVADRAVDYLAEFGKSKNQPFFLAVGFIKPHSPYIAPKKYFDLYDQSKIEIAARQQMPAGAPRIAGHRSGEKRRYTDQPNQGPFSKENQQRTRQAYYACISYIDAQIGKVLAALERNQLADRTIVLLWSDHGYHLGEKGLWGKTTNYELDTRVAFLCRAPGMKAIGKKSKAFVELVDVYPTLADLCGFPVPKHLEGTSVAPLLDRPDRAWKSAAFSQFTKGKLRGYAMTDGQYRYVEWVESADLEAVVARELYDRIEDPEEMRNLVDKAAVRSELVRTLSAKLNKGKGWKDARPQR